MTWPYRFFTPDEMRCRHTGRCEMDPRFMDRLERLRIMFGAPMVVTSGFRDPAHPAEARKGEPGMHAKGRAVDIGVRGGEAIRLVRLAIEVGFKGIGVQQKGEGRFIHLDDRDDPAMWSY